MSTSRRPMLAFLLTAVLVVLTMPAAAAGPSGPTASRSTKVVKGIGAGHWSPTTVRISTGDSIRWRAVSNTHTVTAYGGHWSFNRTLTVGSSATFRFTHAGTYRFRCRFHSTLINGHCSGMCGKVIVS